MHVGAKRKIMLADEVLEEIKFNVGGKKLSSVFLTAVGLGLYMGM